MIAPDYLDIAVGLEQTFGKNVDVALGQHSLIFTAADRHDRDLGISDSTQSYGGGSRTTPRPRRADNLSDYRDW